MLQRDEVVHPAPETQPLIFVVDDDPEQGALLGHLLQQGGYRPQLLGSLLAFSEALQTDPLPAAVIMDMVFPDGDLAGALSIQSLRKDFPGVFPPVLFLSMRQDLDARLAAYRCGSAYYLNKPVEPWQLISQLDTLTLRVPSEPYRVLMVAGDELSLETQTARLRAAGMQVTGLLNSRQALEKIAAFMPDVLLLDYSMPDISGPELVALLREEERYQQLPVVFLSTDQNEYRQLDALNLGGDDFLVMPACEEQLTRHIIARAKRSRDYRNNHDQMQKLLYEREREHLTLNQHALVSIADQAGNITYANDLFCEISGYSHQELLGENHRLLKSGQHPDRFYQDMWATIARGQVWRGEVCNQRKDGSFYWVESTITPFLKDCGQPYQYVSIRTDITHAKAVQDELERARERLRRGQLFANIGTWEWNIVTGDLFWTERIAPLFGYLAGDLATSYENFMGAVHPDDRQMVADAVSSCVEDEVPYDIEHRVVWPDGSIHWLSERGSVERDDAGNPLRMLGVVQDITDLKRAEQDLLVFRRLFDATQQGIGVTDADGYLVYCNSAHDHLLGYEPNECLGKHFTLFFSEQTMQWAPDAIIGAISEGKRWSGLLPSMRKDGGEVITASNVGFIASADGRPQYLFNILSDYGPELERQNQLAQAKEEAERASQAKSAFLSSMSHELRTPMNAILGFGQVLEYDDALGQEQQDSVYEILKAGNHLLELINEVLDLAKVESGQLSLSLEPVELRPVVEECLSLIQPLAKKREIRIRHKGLDHVQVRADRTRLKQVLLNLLSNAVKYNRDGGQVNLKTQLQDDDRLRVLVSDTGMGIPKHRLNELFEPFNRLDAEGSEVEGTGIGLTITRRIMELMGGSIEAESEEGVGSTFWLELPLEDEKQYPDQELDEDFLQQTSGVGEPQHLVLYIEDNPSNLKLVANILGKLPHIHLLSAHLPKLGLELAQARKPDLILLDINMPGMDGYQVLQAIQQIPSLKPVPVVAVTANAMPKDIQRGKAAGFSDYITKPIQMRDFLSRIEYQLKGSSKEKQADK